VYLVIWKVGVTRTYANENKEQPGSFARIFKPEALLEKISNRRLCWKKISKNSTIERLLKQ